MKGKLEYNGIMEKSTKKQNIYIQEYKMWEIAHEKNIETQKYRLLPHTTVDSILMIWHI